MCERMFGNDPTWRDALCEELSTSRHILDQWFAGVRPVPILVVMHLRMKTINHWNELAQTVNDLDSVVTQHENLHMVTENVYARN